MKIESGDAQTTLNRTFREALAYKNGEGVQKNPSKAIEILTYCANQDHTDAQYLLGRIYHTGKSGISQDYEKAFHYYQQAADSGLTEAMNSVGLMYLRGQGIERSPQKAFRYFRQAAHLGHPHAHNNLALFYTGEPGVVGRDLRKVAYHLLLAYSGGFDGALKNIETIKRIARREGTTFEALLNS